MRREKTGTDSDLYQFASLARYDVRQRILIRIADLVISFLIEMIGRSLRFEPMRGWKDSAAGNGKSFEADFEEIRPCVMAFWHDRIFLTTYFWKRDDAAVMVSKSFDGEYISRIAQRFGYGVIRGSSTRGGSSALLKMIRLTKKGIRMAFTVDGPRGPRHKVKKGSITLARRAGIPIVPLLAEAKKAWVIRSWDKTLIPKPFTRAVVFVGEPIYVPFDADREKVEEKRIELERKLDELVVLGKEWRVAKH